MSSTSQRKTIAVKPAVGTQELDGRCGVGRLVTQLTFLSEGLKPNSLGPVERENTHTTHHHGRRHRHLGLSIFFRSSVFTFSLQLFPHTVYTQQTLSSSIKIITCLQSIFQVNDYN